MIASSVSTFAKRSSGLLRPSTTNRFLLQPLSATTQHHQHCRFVHIEKKLEELGIELPPPSGPKANYNIICFARNNTLYMSGHLPIKADGSMVTGKIGGEGGKSVDHGYEAARTIGLGLISSMKEHLGDLDRVEQIVKVRVKMLLLVLFIEYVTQYIL